MNGFNCVSLGEDMTGYSQYDRDSLPAYYSYADRFVVADHFFTSMYGPTFPEHLYTVAAQSYGIVDNKTTTETEGNYCDDPLEYTQRFPLEDLTDADIKRIMALEKNITADPGQLLKIAAYWEQTRTCINIPVLPDELEDAGISWKYYANADAWMNALQAVRHVRFSDMWEKVQTPDTFLTDVKNGDLPEVSWLIPPEGAPNEHPGSGTTRVRGTELDDRVPEHADAQRCVGVHRRRDRVGRLRRLLRPRRAAPLRHHGPRTANPGADHLALDPPG